MFKNGINLQKAIENRIETNIFPNIIYFLTDDYNHKSDGSVDGTPDGLYLGLLQGHSDFKDLIFDETVREDENALLIMSKKVLDMGGRLYIELGLTEDDLFINDDKFDESIDFYSENYFDKSIESIDTSFLDGIDVNSLDEGEIEDILNEYYNYYVIHSSKHCALVKMEEDSTKSGYGMGSFGIFIREDENGNYQYDYAYNSQTLIVCHMPPLEEYFTVSDNPDSYEKAIINIVDKLPIFN